MSTAGNGGIALVPVSLGELIDKITILEIKAERIADPDKLANVREELGLLMQAHARLHGDAVVALQTQLKKINTALWEIEDKIRDCERAKNFGPQFIELARSIYRTNDRRAALKRQINEIAGSAIVEEKSYSDYS
jgi:hypothetical protein